MKIEIEIGHYYLPPNSIVFFFWLSILTLVVDGFGKVMIIQAKKLKAIVSDTLFHVNISNSISFVVKFQTYVVVWVTSEIPTTH